MHSMTGFGQARREIDGCQYAIEIRSVNSRYYKSLLRLPEIWSFVEPEVDQLLRKSLHRGSVHFTLRMKVVSAEAAYQVNVAALERYIEHLETVRPDQADVALSVDLASLLQLPGVCNPPEPEELCRKARPRLMEVVAEAVAALQTMRAEEGKAIARDLEAHCRVIEAQLSRIGARAPTVVRDYQERLRRRVGELTASAELKIDEQDLAREVAVFAERSDIAEELSRLGGHLEQFRLACRQADQPGKKMEFIGQEMLREANTIAPKANDPEIARCAVELKTAIDRIKEQTQNVV